MMDATSISRTAPSSYWLEGFAQRAGDVPSNEDREQVHAWYRTLLAPYVPQHTASALDIGCGHGRVIRAIVVLAPGCRCVGIDGSDTVLTAARSELAENGTEAALYRIDVTGRGFGRFLAEQHGRFDIITSLFVLHHYPPAQAGGILGELRDLLTPRGVMILAEAHDPSSREAALAEQVCAELAALAGQAPDVLWTATELGEACRLGGFGEGDARFETAPGWPFTPAEAAANQQALDGMWADLLAAETDLGSTAASSQVAALKRAVLRMREYGVARPARFGPLLAILQRRSILAHERTDPCR